MRTAIISDIHSNLEALEATLQDIAAHNVGCVLCLGDIVGYNANPIECIQLLRKRNVLCVAGNHDRAVAGQITTEGFGYTAARAVAWTRRHLDADALAYLFALPTDLTISKALVAVHGALHPITGRESVRLDTDERRRLSLNALSAHPSGARICAFGHTHRLGIYELRGGVIRELTGDRVFLREDGWYLVNPGTIGQPRTSDRRATYMIFDSAKSELTTHRIVYDTRTPFRKSRKVGLVPIWAAFPRPVVNAMMRLPTPVRTSLRRGLEFLKLGTSC
ncbi:metallophosphoesterase family protein [Microvirga sp. CF3016]|uniref:metallophosphoesterase family protein n=1 Tax=Microvirga sp. CF3016 TaxID=3110181 RepID=UPI003FA5F0DA